jgi:hypothetical protein
VFHSACIQEADVDGLGDLAPVAKKLWDVYREWQERLSPRLESLDPRRKRRSRTGRHLAGFAAGLGVGVGLGVLFAPGRSPEPGARKKPQTAGAADAPRSLDVVTGVQRPAIQLRPTESQLAERPDAAAIDPLALINQGSREELMAIEGIGPVAAADMIKGRPYASIEAVLQDRNLPPSIVELVQAECLRRKAA